MIESKLQLSLIIPIYNEEQNVAALCNQIREALTDYRYEVLLVDDGSSDRSVQKASDFIRQDSRFRLIKLRRNYGQTPAMVAGIDHAQGSVIVTMDGDLQNDPSDIPKLIERIDEGYDLVVGWRQKRQDALVTRKIPSKIANWLIGKVTGVPIRDNGCSLKAYRAELIKQVPLYGEMHRFIPAIASIAGSKVCEMPVRHHARRYGQSKYGLNRIYKVLLDLIVMRTILSSYVRPLGYFGQLALAPFLIGTLLVILSFVAWTQLDALMLISGVLFCSLAWFLFLWGFMVSLVRKFHSVQESQLIGITAHATEVAGRRRQA